MRFSLQLFSEWKVCSDTQVLYRCFVVWFQQSNFGYLYPLSPAKTMFHAELCNPITRQAIELESCSNTTDSASLVVEIEKKIFVFGGGFSGGNAISGGVFGYLYLALGPNPLSHHYGSRFCRKLGQNPRL